jgi:putative ABC transport system permease protein
MSLREAVRTRRGLRANRLRSALTMLGIVIGVAAVILLVAIGNGVQSAVNEYVEPLANLITIVPTVGNVPGGTAPKDLIDADVSALQNPDRAPDVASVTPDRPSSKPIPPSRARPSSARPTVGSR